MNNLSNRFELLLGHAAFKLWPDYRAKCRKSSLRLLFPTILS